MTVEMSRTGRGIRNCLNPLTAATNTRRIMTCNGSHRPCHRRIAG
jgi:hypothetical protein